MIYELKFSREFKRIFSKLHKKNRKQSEIILKKIREIKNHENLGLIEAFSSLFIVEDR